MAGTVIDLSFCPFQPEAPPLTIDETMCATRELTGSFPRVSRRYADERVPGEPKYALFTFVKAPEPDWRKELVATLDSNDPVKTLREMGERLTNRRVFGAAKIRGAFHTEQEAFARAERIVREQDSAHSIMTCRIGEPFPLTTHGFARECDEIMASTDDVLRESFRREEKARKEADLRVRELRATTQRPTTTDDDYVQLRVKAAYLLQIEAETVDRLRDVRQKALDALTAVVSSPTPADDYLDRFYAARRDVGVPLAYDETHFAARMTDDPLQHISRLKLLLND